MQISRAMLIAQADPKPATGTTAGPVFSLKTRTTRLRAGHTAQAACRSIRKSASAAGASSRAETIDAVPRTLRRVRDHLWKVKRHEFLRGWHQGSPHVTVKHAESTGKAKYSFLLDVGDCWPTAQKSDQSYQLRSVISSSLFVRSSLAVCVLGQVPDSTNLWEPFQQVRFQSEEVTP